MSDIQDPKEYLDQVSYEPYGSPAYGTIVDIDNAHKAVEMQKEIDNERIKELESIVKDLYKSLYQESENSHGYPSIKVLRYIDKLKALGVDIDE